MNQLAFRSVPVRRASPALLAGLPLLVRLLACVRLCALVCTPIPQLIHHKNVETPTTFSPRSIIFLRALNSACYTPSGTKSRAFFYLSCCEKKYIEVHSSAGLYLRLYLTYSYPFFPPLPAPRGTPRPPGEKAATNKYKTRDIPGTYYDSTASRTI